VNLLVYVGEDGGNLLMLAIGEDGESVRKKKKKKERIIYDILI
jgi:hypothetical protein